jgi:hypothetical protein
MKVWVAILGKIQTSKFIREIAFGLVSSQNTTHTGVTAAWIRLELSLNDAVDAHRMTMQWQNTLTSACE